MLLYLVGFIKTVIFLVIVYAIIRLLRGIISEPQKKQSDQSRPNRNTGETTIHYDNKGKKKFDRNEGEYVDFEEVKNSK